MKRKLFCAILLIALVGSGCGKPLDSGNNPSTETSAPDTAGDKTEEYLTAISSIPIEVHGRYLHDLEMDYTLYMQDGQIEEIQPDFIIANGILCNDIDSTEQSVSVKYTIDDTGMPTYGFLVNEEEEIVFTPTIPFELDALYNSESIIITKVIDSDYIEENLTKENFPDIQLMDDWYDNYRYLGLYLLTDKDGNKWISGDRANQGIYYFEDGQWKYPKEIFVDPYVEN